ncbi:CRISPR-associated protein, Cmr2 family [Cyclobacterium xiamenense]|uniref:CRISPR-associated protein, Cmr2 family n=1 Tax=Cyclobacterium xiamenense TaxID=1297121 RepID=A0A1H7C5C9_9BACT|nr:type III-B CRISPR-associated protein Cas10/Cmr2 [Cyclobacterium xiamenense]SEJ81830.1 CRISPR-associated protein, Cmr2 family [Cyclobacterium xiamenense]
MKTYYGITIGPIIKTLMKARKTRELWAASYLFSYLMKSLIKVLKENKAEFIVPFTDEINWGGNVHNILDKPNGAGLFADRCVFYFPEAMSEPSSFDLVIKVIEQTKLNIVKEVIDYLVRQKLFSERRSEREDQLKQHFLDYLQVYAVERDFENPDIVKKYSEAARDVPEQNAEPPMNPALQAKNIVREIYGDLDVLELQSQVIPLESTPWIELFINKAALMRQQPSSFLVDDALQGDAFERNRFESLIEIAARELVDHLDREEQTSFLSKIENDANEESLMDYLKGKNPGLFKTPHKYIAIIQADGDKIGACIKELDNSQYLKFSKALLAFSLHASDAIRDYGGLPVYIGGDDLLFFAPIRYGARDVFSLIDDLDALFSAFLSPLALSSQPTLSFGISIAYYKFPLNENREKALSQLSEVAKQFKFRKGVKNAVATFVQKHSGQTFGLTLQKSAEVGSSYAVFKELVRMHIEQQHFLNSVSQHLSRDWPLILKIYSEKEKLKSLFDNNFNEGIHQEGKNRHFLEKLQEMILAMGRDFQEKHLQESIYGALRLIKFLNRDDND